MALVDSLRSVGVIEYETIKDVPYVRDDSWGTLKGAFGIVHRATRSST
jgi:hypothetical protein